MENIREKEIDAYIFNREAVANKYTIKCFAATMIIYTVAFILNLLKVFIIENKLVVKGYLPSLVIFIIVIIVVTQVSLSNRKLKYFIMFMAISVYTIMGVTITYHVVLAHILPLLCCTLYSSKKIVYYAYGLTVLSTIAIVFGGYYYGLCDANMALLTADTLSNYNINGQFIHTTINTNPILTLSLYFVVPRCLIYIAFVVVCNSIVDIMSGSIERAEITKELEKAKEEAENANMAKTQFLTKMSHEIRTPVNAVIGMNEMILYESTEENIKEYARDVKHSSTILLNIINEILDSSKIESGMMEIVPVKYKIGNMLSDLYNMIYIRAQEKNLDFVFDIDAKMPSEFLGDDKRIKQILTNLLTNAIKYTNKGSVVLKVKCIIDKDEAIIQFYVRDTGIGIREEHIEDIYDVYKRLDTSRNRNIEGTGLGINICQQLLELMGSELYIKSEYEVGSEFSFAVVQKIINTEPVGDFQEILDNEEHIKNYRIGFVAPKIRVLVVDDNKMNLKVFKSLLKQTKMQISEAESGMQCIEMLKNNDYDIIFLDHMMPYMDGVETLQTMKAYGLCKNIPVVMLTANAIVGSKEKYLKMGFDDFVTKPIVLENLEKTFLQLLPEHLFDSPDEEKEQKENVVIEPIDEFDFDYALKNLGDMELLKGLLVDFNEFINEFEGKIEPAYTEIEQEERLTEYRIMVHSLKSNAAIVGALLLSKTARLLECAAIDKDVDKIKTLHPILLDELSKHKERLKVLILDEDNDKLDNIEMEYFDMLATALENQDYDLMDELSAKIQKYTFKEEVEPLVSKLKSQVFNLETDEAIATIYEIKKAMGE